jgi:hypothetical protein
VLKITFVAKFLTEFKYDLNISASGFLIILRLKIKENALSIFYDKLNKQSELFDFDSMQKFFGGL